MIDLRSDTVTRPSPEMRRAMAEAEVGDDVFGEDPTMALLEAKAAEIVGFDAALFVPSGTMGNQVAIAVHTRPGQEVILEERCHIFNYEMGAMAALSGTLPRPLASRRGVMDPELVAATIRPDLSYMPKTGLIALENSSNGWGGAVMSVEAKDAIVAVAQRHGIPVHLDGARLFNAATALSESARELARGCDSVMFSLSKGLGAPVGSLLASTRAFIGEARRVRKRFGGGMRQVGILAAAGLMALDNRERLPLDHARACRLADAINRIPGLQSQYGGTNIVMMDCDLPTLGAERFTDLLRERDILSIPFGARRVRFVTHLDVDDAAIDATITALGQIVAAANQ